jgi:hypothetical protein
VPLSVADFRALFPEFSDPSAVPDVTIQFNLNLAYASLRPSVWQDRLDAAAAYFTAHYVYMSRIRKAQADAASSGASVIPGQASGVVSSKSVGGVSVSYDTSGGRTEGGGVFNLSTYGQEYLSMLDSVTVGVIQL